MKGGDVVALGVMRAWPSARATSAELALLLVCDEEWRQAPFAHAARFAGWDACLCFEAGERSPDGDDAVIVGARPPARVQVPPAAARRTPAPAPTRAATPCWPWRRWRACWPRGTRPDGPDRLTCVPTVLRSGDGLNVVPAAGELTATSARRSWPRSRR